MNYRMQKMVIVYRSHLDFSVIFELKCYLVIRELGLKPSDKGSSDK
jgi:hypothetical protein